MKHALALVLLFLPAAFAQNGIALRDNRNPQLSCSGARYCEMRQETVSSTGNFVLEGFHNGEVTVQGWARPEVEVRLRVWVKASSERDARNRFSQVHTRVSPGRVVVDGPNRSGSFFNWSWEPEWEVSAEVFVPQSTGVRATTHNGKLLISDLKGRAEAQSHNGRVTVERVTADVRATAHNGELRLTDIGGNVDYEAHNGAAVMTRVHGSVRGTSHNGRTDVELSGPGVAARRVDLENHNGAITIAMPRSFSAHVRSESHHGQLSSDFAAPRRGDSDVVDFNIGSGEASIRVRTHNGGVKLRAI